MASLFSHALVGWAAAKVAGPQPVPKSFGWLCAFCACLPDADVVGFAIGIRYEDVLGHRGLTHSLFFALAFGFGVALLGYRASPYRWRLGAVLAVATASHGVLDAMTNGGLGIGFFSPIDPTRYFFPFRPIAVSPIGIQAFFSEWGARVLLSELLWVWLPTGLLVLGASLVRRVARAAG